MLKVLFVSHVKDTTLSNGGAVFSKSIVNLIRTAFTAIEITEIYSLSSKNMLYRNCRKLMALLKSFTSSRPSKYYYFYSSHFYNKINSKLATHKYDLVVIDHAEMLWVADIVPAGVPVVHLSQNIEHILYRHYTDKLACKPIIGSLLTRDALNYKRYEIEKVCQVRNIITVSFEDLDYWKSLDSGINAITVNPVFSYPPAKPKRKTLDLGKIYFGFLANMEWWPNSDAINWLIKNVLPHLEIRYELHLFGKASARYGNGSNIIGHGFVQDIGDVWKKVNFMVAPIVAGGGVNVKVAESIYNKVPLICTSKAIKGMHLVPDRSVVVLDTAEQWINFLNSVSSLTELVSCNDFPNAVTFSLENQTRLMRDYLSQVMA